MHYLLTFFSERCITIALTGFYLDSFFKGFSLDILLVYLLHLQTICSARWKNIHIFSVSVFLIKQDFPNGELKFIEETIELQKKQTGLRLTN